MTVAWLPALRVLRHAACVSAFTAMGTAVSWWLAPLAAFAAVLAATAPIMKITARAVVWALHRGAPTSAHAIVNNYPELSRREVVAHLGIMLKAKDISVVGLSDRPEFVRYQRAWG